MYIIDSSLNHHWHPKLCLICWMTRLSWMLFRSRNSRNRMWTRCRAKGPRDTKLVCWTVEICGLGDPSAGNYIWYTYLVNPITRNSYVQTQYLYIYIYVCYTCLLGFLLYGPAHLPRHAWMLRALMPWRTTTSPARPVRHLCQENERLRQHNGKVTYPEEVSKRMADHDFSHQWF